MLLVSRIGAVWASALVLLVPAIWNRFPLLEYDTGGYLARWFEPWLVPSRSTVYGLFLVLLARPDFWLVVIVQSLLTIWVLSLVLRAIGFGGRPLLLLGVTLALGVLTTLPWIAAVLLTDIFAGLAVLAVHLLVFADTTLRRWERHALFALLAFAVATHSATFAVVLGLVLVAGMARCAFRIGSVSGIARSAAALVLGALMLLTANYAASGRFVWTPGGGALSFGRMLQDGVVHRYLAEHCRDRHLRLCAHRAELPDDADVFFWSGDDRSLFNRLGRFQGLGDEMAEIVVDSLRAYPVWQAKLAVAATARQLTHVATGEGVVESDWHTYWAIDTFAPRAAPAMHAARQQHGELGFSAINRVHRPAALISMLLLVAIACVGWRRRFSDLAALATTTLVALLGNAVVCGVFANPHDRYGARLAWLAPLVVGLALYRLFAERSRWTIRRLAPTAIPPV